MLNEPWENEVTKYVLNKSFRDVQIFITPDPKIVPGDLKPKFELSLIEFK